MNWRCYAGVHVYHGDVTVAGAIVSTTALGAYVLATAGILHQGLPAFLP
jgi:hypothetical protein